MPTFSTAKSGDFRFVVKPKSFLRRFFPYFVGDRVKFDVTFSKADSIPDGSIFFLFEFFGGDEKRSLSHVSCSTVLNKTITFIGNPIDREGDVRYRLGFSEVANNAYTIVSAHASNKDRWFPACAGLVVGGIITFAVSLALGILEIDKFWHIVNPFFKHP